MFKYPEAPDLARLQAGVSFLKTSWLSWLKL